MAGAHTLDTCITVPDIERITNAMSDHQVMGRDPTPMDVQFKEFSAKVSHSLDSQRPQSTSPLRIEVGYTYGYANLLIPNKYTFIQFVTDAVLEHHARVYLFDMCRYLAFIPTYVWVLQLKHMYEEWVDIMNGMIHEPTATHLPQQNLAALVGIVGLFQYVKTTSSKDVGVATKAFKTIQEIIPLHRRLYVDKTLRESGFLRLGVQLMDQLRPGPRQQPDQPAPPMASRGGSVADVDTAIMALVRSNSSRVDPSDLHRVIRQCFDTVASCDKVFPTSDLIRHLLGPVLGHLLPMEMIARIPLAKRFSYSEHSVDGVS